MKKAIAVAVMGLVLAPAGAPAARGGAAAVAIQIDSPRVGQMVKSKLNLAAIRGSVQSGNGDPVDFDVMVAIDVSYSTRFPSGIDVDGDGELGFNPHDELIEPGSYPEDVVCSDPDDTILAAEIRAASTLLEVLREGRTQVGLLTFSGAVNPETGRHVSADQRDAELRVPLTADFASVAAELDAIARRGPSGATNFAAAVQLSVVELAGLNGARSQPRPAARKVLLFLTDGNPTFPFGRGNQSDPEDIEAAISAARLARSAKVTINTYALGRSALMAPVAVTEMARLTLGSYTPVRNPGDIVAFLQGISFANVEDVVIVNLTTRDVSYDVSLSPDGSFSGFVPVSEGENVVQVTALASDGGEGSVELRFDFETSGLSERELIVELDRIKQRNKQLQLLLERDRIKRFRERQRKSVVIEAGEKR